MRAKGKGRDQQDETIQCNAAGQHSSSLGRIVSREQQKDGSASDRIDDGKERAHYQENALGNLNEQENLRWFLDLNARPSAVHLRPDGFCRTDRAIGTLRHILQPLKSHRG